MPPGPGDGRVGGDIKALVAEVHRSQQRLLAQVAPTAVAWVPQDQRVEPAPLRGASGHRGAQAHAHHADLAGTAAAQEIHGGAHRSLPGFGPARVAAEPAESPVPS